MKKLGILFYILIGVLTLALGQLVSAECHQNSQGVWINEWNSPCPPGSGSTTSPDDKVIATIDYCYNLTINIDKDRGVTVPISFKDCTKKDDNTWTCDCKKNNAEEFDVVLQTDKTQLDSEDARVYTVQLLYTTYDKIQKEKLEFTVKDYGDTATTSGKETTHLGSNVVEKIVQVNNTVYVDREVPKIEYVDRTNTVTVEDTTKIAALNESLNYCTVKVQQKTKAGNWLWVIVLVLAGFIGYKYYKSKR